MFDPLVADLGNVEQSGHTISQLYECTVVFQALNGTLYYLASFERSQAYVADETPDAEKWQEVKQLQADHAVVNVKIKEIVKGGAVAYLD